MPTMMIMPTTMIMTPNMAIIRNTIHKSNADCSAQLDSIAEVTTTNCYKPPNLITSTTAPTMLLMMVKQTTHTTMMMPFPDFRIPSGLPHPDTMTLKYLAYTIFLHLSNEQHPAIDQWWLCCT